MSTSLPEIPARTLDVTDPAVQNRLLATRALGFGTVLTTSHVFLPGEFERVIDLPSAATLAAVVPVGRPRRRSGPVSYATVESVLSRDRWRQRLPEVLPA